MVSYPISGTIYKGTSEVFPSIIVRVTNNDTAGYVEDTTDSSGNYSVNITGTNGDSLTIRCNSVYKTTTVDTTGYPSGKTINLIAYVKFLIESTLITGIISVTLNKTISSKIWQATIVLENKNGYRSTSYNSFNDIILQIDGQTVMKGRIRDLDVTTEHRLILICENYTVLLNDRYIHEDAFSGKTIYYAITDATYGIVTPYLSTVTTGSVPNNSDTQTVFSKTFDKETVSSGLIWLGNQASSIGYDFYVDNDKVLQFKERRSIDGGVTLSNTGRFKNTLSWDWRESSGKDIYNRVVIYGNEVEATRNDTTSQGTYGIREHPPITDTSLLTTGQCNNVGDNIVARFGNPFKEAEMNVKIGVITNDSTFDQQFPLYFETDRRGIIELEAGQSVAVKIVGSGINDTTPEQRVILSIEHKFPQYMAKIKLSEYYKDLSSMISDTTQRGYK